MLAVVEARRVLRLHLAIAAAGIAVLLLIAAAFVQTLSFAAPSVPLRDEHWNVVRWALELGSLELIALGSVSVAACVAGVRSLWRQSHHSRHAVRALPVRGQIADATVIADHRPLAFCAGLLRPRIFVSTATVEMLDPRQLEAVLEHERQHRQRRDPLRILIVRSLADALFIVPALSRLAARYAALLELAADARAVQANGGDPAPLASALLTFDERGPDSVGVDPARVDHLLGEHRRWQLPLTVLAWSVLIMAAMLAAGVRAIEANEALTLSMPLLARPACLIAADLGPLFLGAALLLAARGVLARRRT